MTIQAYKESSIIISADKKKVWDTLINPEHTVQYMYGCKVKSNWSENSTVDWIGAEDNITYVTGILLKFEPFKSLIYTVIEPAPAYPTTIENHLKVQCTLIDVKGGTQLQIIQGDYIAVADGEKRYGHSDDSWDSILTQIKAIAEK